MRGSARKVQVQQHLTSRAPPRDLALHMRQRGLHSTPSLLSHPRKMKTKTIFGFSISLVLINLASILERADETLLPAVYREVGEAFNAGPTELGYLTFIMSFVQSIASPIAGVLSLQYDRSVVLAMGTTCWAISTAAVGISQHIGQVAFWRAVNGLGLAIVIPVLQSFIADSYGDGSHGAGFGLFSLVSMIGRIGGGPVTTIMAGKDYWGIPGWRFAFLIMASVSLLIALLVHLFVVDPRKNSPFHHGSDVEAERSSLIKRGRDSLLSPLLWHNSWIAMSSVAKVKTFQVIVLQGIVGSLPWASVAFFTMWFELIGFDHNSAAGLMGLFAIGCAIGSFCGGLIADWLSRYYPDSARVMCAQFSAFMGIPFSLILLVVIPQSIDYWYTYALTLFSMGLSISWCGVCANQPMFAVVVPPKHRTMIYSFDRALEGSFASFATPAIGMVAEQIYGYNLKSMNPANGSAQGALALSRGLLTMTVVPFGLCSLFYSPLYFVFKQDRDSARLATSKDQELEFT